MTKPEALDGFVTRTAWIGDRQVYRMDLHADQEMIYVGPSESKVPDLDWTYTDRKGHWHAFADDGSHPTMIENQQKVSTGLDPDDFYTIGSYACRICNQTIAPNFKTKTNDDYVPGMTSWRVEALMTKLPIPVVGTTTVIRLIAGDTLAFGVAVVANVEYSPGEALVSLDGIGPLAYRYQHDA